MPLNLCEVSDFYFAIYLFMVIFSHLFIPHTDNLHKKVHSNLIIVFLAQAADIYDFSEYQTQSMVNVNIIYGYLFLNMINDSLVNFTILVYFKLF